MSSQSGKNVAASVRGRLLQLAKESGEDFQLMLTRYGLERLLFRLSQSPHREQFVLKGAMLFSLWGGETYRATRDVDFLAFGDSAIDHVVNIFRELCEAEVADDGLTFLPDSVQAEDIREEQEYDGIRVRLVAMLGAARIPIQADIGFGDAVTPGTDEIEYPTLIESDSPKLRAYPPETVVAEKYQAMVYLGIANSRMKDFYDIHVIARQFVFSGELLADAIRNTFERRKTPIPKELPLAFTEDFYRDSQKQKQWSAFLKKGRLASDQKSLEDVCVYLRDFLMPLTESLAKEKLFTGEWSNGGPWKRIKKY